MPRRISGSRPRLLHRRTSRLAPGGSTTGSTTAADDAAGDQKEEETADAGGEADDERFVVVDPGADFLEGGGVFAYALWFVSFGCFERERKRGRPTFEHVPPPPQLVPSKKFCCIL